VSALHGWLVLDKPVGLGSTQAVSLAKRAIRQAGLPKAKVGHGGTLDPLASGVLPIAIGEATKLTGRMLDADKTYAFTIAFGVETDTLDLEGAAVAESEVRPTEAEIAAVLPRFTGPIAQVPPAYSALKVDGRRAYDLARAGEAVELATRLVTIHDLKALSPCGRGLGEGSVPSQFAQPGIEPGCANPSPRPSPARGEGVAAASFRARVSKGTYIRSLARDIALALGTVGHVSMLRRTQAGPFDLSQAISVDKLRETATGAALQALLLPLAAGLDGIPALALTPDQAQALRQGRRLDGAAALPGLRFATLGHEPVALVEDGRVVRGFNPMPE